MSRTDAITQRALVEVDRSAETFSRVDAEWVVREPRQPVATLRLSVDGARCVLVRREGTEERTLREEQLLTSESLCVCGMASVTVEGVLMVVVGGDGRTLYARSAWIDALEIAPGCCALSSVTME